MFVVCDLASLWEDGEKGIDTFPWSDVFFEYHVYRVDGMQV